MTTTRCFKGRLSNFFLHKERLPSLRPLRALRLNALLVLCVLFSLSVTAQIQQAWVARYNNGIANGTNQAVKMALDSTGNIYVTGFSQNSLSNLGYVTIKYAPNGNQLWTSRYDSTNYPSAMPSAFALDGSNNVVVTGSALTVKYDPNGNLLWTAPYNGSAVAVDAGGNSLVTGFGSGFNTVKIDTTGSNSWITAYNNTLGPALSLVLAVDGNSNVYVAGSDTYICIPHGDQEACGRALLIVKYDQSGKQLWTAENLEGDDTNVNDIQVKGLVLDSVENVYCLANGPIYMTGQWYVHAAISSSRRSA